MVIVVFSSFHADGPIENAPTVDAPFGLRHSIQSAFVILPRHGNGHGNPFDGIGEMDESWSIHDFVPVPATIQRFESAKSK